MKKIQDIYSFKLQCEQSEAKLRNSFIETDNVCFVLQTIEDLKVENNCDLQIDDTYEINMENNEMNTEELSENEISNKLKNKSPEIKKEGMSFKIPLIILSISEIYDLFFINITFIPICFERFLLSNILCCKSFLDHLTWSFISYIKSSYFLR